MKQDLATKEIEQRLKQEIERQKLNETLSLSIPMPESEVGATKSGNFNTLKTVTYMKDRHLEQDNLNDERQD